MASMPDWSEGSPANNPVGFDDDAARMTAREMYDHEHAMRSAARDMRTARNEAGVFEGGGGEEDFARRVRRFARQAERRDHLNAASRERADESVRFAFVNRHILGTDGRPIQNQRREVDPAKYIVATPETEALCHWAETTNNKADQTKYEAFKCPISLSLMRDPVVAADGHTYERAYLTKHFRTHGVTGPVGNEPLETAILYPNTALRKAMECLIWEDTKLAAGERTTTKLLEMLGPDNKPVERLRESPRSIVLPPSLLEVDRLREPLPEDEPEPEPAPYRESVVRGTVSQNAHGLILHLNVNRVGADATNALGPRVSILGGQRPTLPNRRLFEAGVATAMATSQNDDGGNFQVLQVRDNDGVPVPMED